MSILNEKEIAEAQALISKMVPGIYELKDIYQSNQRTIENPTAFGKKFKATVEKRLISDISIDEKKSNNHQTYKIK